MEVVKEIYSVWRNRIVSPKLVDNDDFTWFDHYLNNTIDTILAKSLKRFRLF